MRRTSTIVHLRRARPRRAHNKSLARPVRLRILSSRRRINCDSDLLVRFRNSDGAKCRSLPSRRPAVSYHGSENSRFIEPLKRKVSENLHRQHDIPMCVTLHNTDGEVEDVERKDRPGGLGKGEGEKDFIIPGGQRPSRYTAR